MGPITGAFMTITGVIKNIITYPFRALALALRVPNFKLVYKSGHVEYIFFTHIKISGDTWEWEHPGSTGKSILTLSVEDISSVFQLY